MTKNRRIEEVGDAKAPSLQATKSDLRDGVDQAEHIIAAKSERSKNYMAMENVGLALKSSFAHRSAPTSCKQNLWLSFFFDGTGNNLNADSNLLKHSNVARLYRAHKPNSAKDGRLSLYIPGIGTYFPEIGDDGGSGLGLGFGAKGQGRLDFAVKVFDDFLAKPLARAKAPENAIHEINIAVFGFSRGAALARKFVNMIMDGRCEHKGGKWRLQSGAWPIRFRFLGLFDTVASVGLPMSSNTAGARESYIGDTAGLIAKRLQNYRGTRPEELAFSASARPGADPAPGKSNGHDEWGNGLRIHETVEEVRHFIAAHEIRNSFPLDSVSTSASGRISKPAHFHEAVYPGAHSDVGGGYAPGEGARSLMPTESLSLIPLRHMYDCALRHGVPMLAEWTADNQNDFDAHPALSETYNHYLKAVGDFTTLGDGMNRHMALYYGWRFKVIREIAMGNKNDASLISSQGGRFREMEAACATEVEALKLKETMAQVSANALIEAKEMRDDFSEGSSVRGISPINDADIEKARQEYGLARDARLRAKARKDAIPNMTMFEAMLNLYDRQLLADVRTIQWVVRSTYNNKRRSELRPHYKILLEAYENEFEKGNGLKDEKVFRFFENYVHNSLAGFAKDATLPSDPRVVYVGGDEKYRYANLEAEDQMADDKMRTA